MVDRLVVIKKSHIAAGSSIRVVGRWKHSSDSRLCHNAQNKGAALLELPPRILPVMILIDGLSTALVGEITALKCAGVDASKRGLAVVKLMDPKSIVTLRPTRARRPPGACMCGNRCATTTAHWTPLPHHQHHRRRRRRRRQHVKDAAQGVLEDVAEDVVQDLAFGARAARALLATPPPPPPPSLCSSR